MHNENNQILAEMTDAFNMNLNKPQRYRQV